jgi:hypothetical protein
VRGVEGAVPTLVLIELTLNVLWRQYARLRLEKKETEGEKPLLVVVKDLLRVVGLFTWDTFAMLSVYVPFTSLSNKTNT